MRRSQKSQFDYHSYRGRTTVTDWLKRIALVLAVLVVILVAALFFGQGFLSYTDDGLRVNLPFFSQQAEPQTPDPGSVTVTEGDPAALPDASQEETTPPEEPQADASSILSVSLSSLLDGSAAQLAQEAGADGVVVTMKDDQGALGWQSQQALASALQEGVDSGTVNAALTAWNEGDVYTVARLSCFRDEALGSNMDYTLRTSSGYRWRDSGDLHWATPSNEAVRSYLIGLMTELAQMGFDEIVLDHFGYPTQADGSLSNLGQSEDNYPAGALDGVITDFLAQAAQALEPYGTKLSLHASADVLTGADGSAGLTPAALNASVDRVWVSGTRSDVLAALEGAGVVNAADRLVSLVDQLDPAAADAQAVWSE